MAVSTRHMHHQRLRGSGGDGELEEGARDDQVHQRQRDPRRRPPPSRALHKSVVLDALSDADSDLARFLFVRSGHQRGDGDGRLSWQSNATDAGDGETDGETDVDAMPRLKKSEASFYALALEPLEIRNERIIMLFEAYTIFGALFMASVWIVYEWGSAKGYGGDGTSAVVDRLFECVMAIALCCNLALALTGANWWIHSINVNSSHEDFFIESIEMLSNLQKLLVLTNQFVFVGFVLGLYCNLSPNLPETIVALSLAVVLYVQIMSAESRHMWNTIPLEIYHLPRWVQFTGFVFPQMCSKGRKELKARAKARAQVLKERAYRERKKLDPSFDSARRAASPVGDLLRNAAVTRGMPDCDVSTYEARLKEDWQFEVNHLRNKDVDWLSRYMPYGLAEEVHALLLEAPERNGMI